MMDEDGAVVAETLIKGSEGAVPQACEEDSSTPDRGRYATTSEVFLQPGCIPNSEEEDVSVGGGSDSTQRNSSECVPVVDCSFQGTGTSALTEFFAINVDRFVGPGQKQLQVFDASINKKMQIA
jgi:hypothetical protein